LQEIGERIDRVPLLFLCLDFDGTLTSFKEDPGLVFLSPQMQRALLSLVANEKVSLALISGRERSDLQLRVGIPNIIYAGNHGLEISGPGFVFVEPTAASCTEELKELAAELAGKLQSLAGTHVEDKGLTLSVHYRQACASSWEDVRRIVHAVLAKTRHPFHLTTGEKVYEIRPRVYWNKGSAVRWLLEQTGEPDSVVIYLGDDVTDEDAFAALPEGITIKVGEPAETKGHYYLENLREVRKFLEWLDVYVSPRMICASGTKAQ